MSKNSTRSDRTSEIGGCIVVPSLGRRLIHCNTLLWLALPLALVAGCASGPSRSAVTTSFTDLPAPRIEPASESRTANTILVREIFDLFMADTRIDYCLSAGVDGGVVTLGGTSPFRVERQRVTDQIWDLSGVSQVRDERGDAARTLVQWTGN
jgi:hypothetical protein